MMGHRGITHSLPAVIAMLGLLVAATAMPEYAVFRWIAAPLCIGYLSHIFGDMLTPSGVPLLYPRRKNFSLNVFRMGDWQETMIVGALGLIVFIFGGVGILMVEQVEYGFEVLRSMRNFQPNK